MPHPDVPRTTQAADATPGKGARVEAAAAVLARWAWRLLAVAAASAVVLWLVAQAWVVLFPVVLGLMLATLLEPAVRRLRPRIGSSGAASLVLLAAVAGVSGAMWLLAPEVAGQVRPLSVKVADGVEDLRHLLAGPPFRVGDSQIGAALDQAAAEIRGNALSIGGGVWNGVLELGSLLLNTILALVMCFFVLKDGPRFVPWLSRLAGPAAAPHITEVTGRLWQGLAGFVRAQALVGLVDSVAIGVALMLLDVPLAVPLAVLIFAGSFIPVIGALATGAVAALVALVAGGPTTALIVVIVVVVVNQVEGNVLAPLLLGKSLALHPAVIMGAVTVGGAAAGIVGAFLAVPAAAAAAVLFRYTLQQLDGPTEQPEAAEEDPADPTPDAPPAAAEVVDRPETTDTPDPV